MELLRAVPAGYLQACASTFFLLIAVKRFEAGPMWKACVATGPFVGLLVSPWLVVAARRSARPIMSIAAAVMAAGAACFVVALASPALLAYVVGAVLGLACAEMVVPLVTVVYQRNYAADRTGRWVGLSNTMKVAATAVSGTVVGGLLRRDLARYRWVVMGAIVACLVSAVLLGRLRSTALGADERSMRRAMPNFGLLASDRILRTMMISWMLMGTANLMMIPLRVEYLTNARYGVNLDTARVALYTVTIPSVARLLLLPVFGLVFDKASFFVVRIGVNVGFAAAIVAFFTGSSDLGLAIGATIFGASSAGGDLLWSLWVVRLAPPEKVPEYMAMHTFTTGVRGIAAPFLAFWIVGAMSVAAMAVLAATLIGAASVVLLPDARAERAARRAVAASARAASA